MSIIQMKHASQSNPWKSFYEKTIVSLDNREATFINSNKTREKAAVSRMFESIPKFASHSSRSCGNPQ